MRHLSFLTLLVFLIHPAFAQRETALTSSHGQDQIADLKVKESSQLFKVKIIPKSKHTEFYVSGKKAGEFRNERLRMRGTYMMGGQNVPISITRQNDKFLTKDPIQGRDLTLDITDEESGRSERINLGTKK